MKKKISKVDISKSVKEYMEDPANEEEIRKTVTRFERYFDKVNEKEEFIKNGGTIFPSGDARRFNKLNKYEQEEVVSYLDQATAPTTGIFVGDTPEEKYGIKLLDDIALKLSS